MHLNGLRQFVESVVLEAAAWVGLGFSEQRERHVAVLGGIDNSGVHEKAPFERLRCMKLWSKRAALCPLRCGKGLGASGLLPLEDFKKALQTQVVIPCLCEQFMLRV